MATLRLGALHCVRKQDVTRHDEPRVLVDGKVVWAGSVSGGGIADLAPAVADFGATARLTLEQRAGAQVTQIGASVLVDAGATAPLPAVFRAPAGHYELYYAVGT